MKSLSRYFSGYDPYLLLAFTTLCVIGLFGVYSATFKGTVSTLFFKQMTYVLVGFVLILILSRLNFRSFFELSPVLYLLNVFLLVLVPVVGKTVYGAKRWLDLGPVSIQPSELFKFSLVMFFLYTISHTRRFISRESAIFFISLLIPSVLTLKQPDLGTTITYVVIAGLVLFFWGVKLRYFFMLAFVLLLASPLLWHALKDYQKSRILAVLDPYEDYSGSGYQLIQSIIAVGSGGIAGKGLLEGTQSHLLFLPEKHTDFIFSVIAEELGFVGAFILLLSIYLIFYRLMVYSLQVSYPVEKVYLGTFAGLWLFQSMVNLFMTMGWAPVVGMPLPFVSYGGSSILTFSLFMGLALSIIREQKNRPIKFEGG